MQEDEKNLAQQLPEATFPQEQLPGGMPMYEQTLAKAEAEGGMLGVSAIAHRPTISELLHHKRNALAKELEFVDAAIAAAQANEGAMNLLDAIAKTQVARNY